MSSCANQNKKLSCLLQTQILYKENKHARILLNGFLKVAFLQLCSKMWEWNGRGIVDLNSISQFSAEADSPAWRALNTKTSSYSISSVAHILVSVPDTLPIQSQSLFPVIQVHTSYVTLCSHRLFVFANRNTHPASWLYYNSVNHLSRFTLF